MRIDKYSEKKAKQKWRNGSIDKLLKHITRFEYDPNIHHNNQLIDVRKSSLNIELLKDRQNIDYCEYLKSKTDLPKRYKSNSVKLVSVILTLPKELVGKLSYKQEYEFFRKGSELIYDYWNVPDAMKITSTIHFDETTPHCHITWCPVALDQKTQEWVFNAKHSVQKFQLDTFHDQIEAKLKNAFPDWNFSLASEKKEDRAKGMVPMEIYKELLAEKIKPNMKQEANYFIQKVKEIPQKENYPLEIKNIFEKSLKNFENKIEIMLEKNEKVENQTKNVNERNEIDAKIFLKQSNNMNQEIDSKKEEIEFYEDQRDEKLEQLNEIDAKLKAKAKEYQLFQKWKESRKTKKMKKYEN